MLTPVVPHAGTWIEIGMLGGSGRLHNVVPHAGTWIEICIISFSAACSFVVPHAGTWIEIITDSPGTIVMVRRSPRGNVD